MRVEKEYIDFLKREIKKVNKSAEVYLFGSRVNDRKKGGDIDIFILSGKKLNPLKLAIIKARFYQRFGERKIDLINYTHNEPSVFKELIMEDAIRL